MLSTTNFAVYSSSHHEHNGSFLNMYSDPDSQQQQQQQQHHHHQQQQPRHNNHLHIPLLNQSTNYKTKPTIEYLGKPERERGNRVRINISGKIFETYMSTLVSKDDSIFNLDIIQHYYDDEREEYYFDRDCKAFEAIFTYLQSGVLWKPDNVPYRVFIEELQFFGFGDIALKLFKEGFGSIKKDKDDSATKQSLRDFTWNILEDPDHSRTARVLSILSSTIIFLSIVVFLVETLPSIKPNEISILKDIEACCVIWFTIELLTRFIVSKKKVTFVRNWMNLVDLLSILPFYIDLMLRDTNNDLIAFAMLRVLRLARVFRVFKLYRYSKSIHLIIHTVISSVRELLLLLFFVLIITILFASGIYYFENDQDSPFQSIPHTFWFCIVTITTVGYGDIVPETAGGKIISSIMAVSGVLVIALPIPIIVNNFTRFFEKIMSDSPAYRFEFDRTKSHQVKIIKNEESVAQMVTAL